MYLLVSINRLFDITLRRGGLGRSCRRPPTGAVSPEGKGEEDDEEGGEEEERSKERD